MGDAGAKLGVYVSVPFCRAKCSFCNFASGVGTPAAVEAYVEELVAEIEGAEGWAEGLGAELPRAVDTVYLGGGTPSLLDAGQLERVFAALGRVFAVEREAEVTLEAAPGQIADEALAAALRLGVNRVSLGVQSFVDREAAAVGRSHTGAGCVREIERLRRAGVREIGVDLIAGLPYQNEASWAESLEWTTGAAQAAGLSHVSVYMLEVDEESRLGQEVRAGGQRFHAHGVPAEEIAAELYEQACERLEAAGFAQYEISNFAGAEHRSRHNVKYWQRAPYVGFGLDAHSMLRVRPGAGRGGGSGAVAVRVARAEELSSYGRAAGPLSARVKPVWIGAREAFAEQIFLGLRMNEGVEVASLYGEGNGFAEPCAARAKELVEEGLLSEVEGFWRLTGRGRLVSNSVFGHLLG